ncbi:MAG: FAD-binding oxidoreductase [Bacteroidota bacterium]
MHITNWGKYPTVNGRLHPLRNFALDAYPSWIPRGMGRSYGDASLAEHMVNTLSCNRFLAFDEENGILHCEAGVTYEEILRFFIPKGWFPPVTPGTKFVSIGGALAADVHGKNHHVSGSISQYTLGIELQIPSGEVILCTPEENEDIFWATMGGMGLTGIIRTAWITLIPIESSLIRMTTVRARNLEEILKLFEQHQNRTYSVAWIDCFSRGKKEGRSLLMLGEHATRKEIKKKKELAAKHGTKYRVPFNFPNFALNPLSIKAFNSLYYHKQIHEVSSNLVGYDSFFYPLDSINDWNRIYGKKGFVQYQCVIPKENGVKGLREILRRISTVKMGSFLAVLKLMGPNPHQSYLSFPMEGYTLALDFPVKKRLFPFLHLLDKFVTGLGGRVYLAKDARMNPDAFEEMYPGLDNFRYVLQKLGNEGQVNSLLADRLNIFGT